MSSIIPAPATITYPPPDDETREQVKSMAAYRKSDEEIALVLGIPVEVLRVQFRYELDTGPIIADCEVAQVIYQRAVGVPAGGGSPGVPGDLAACRAWNEMIAKAGNRNALNGVDLNDPDINEKIDTIWRVAMARKEEAERERLAS